MFDDFTVIRALVLLGASVGLVKSCAMVGLSVLAHAKWYFVISLIGVAFCYGGFCILWTEDGNFGYLLCAVGIVISFLLYYKASSND